MTAVAAEAGRMYQHWTRPRGAGTKAIGVVYCAAHSEQMAALNPVGRHVVRLSPSAAKGRPCSTCGQLPGGTP